MKTKVIIEETFKNKENSKIQEEILKKLTKIILHEMNKSK